MANWIAGAIKHPGAFSAKAKKAGMSTQAFAKKEKGAGGKLGKQANLAMTLSHLAKHRSTHLAHALTSARRKS